MKKTIVTGLICVALMVFSCTGCGLGSYRDHPGAVGGGSDSDVTDVGTGTSGGDVTASNIASGTPSTGTADPTPSDDEPYTVSLLYKNKPFAPKDQKIEVIWHGRNSDTVVQVGENGEANAGVLDGEFDIYLSDLPEGYSYNPNIYRATGNDRHVDINIVDIQEPVKGNGGVTANPSSLAIYQSGGCYVVNYQGTYRVSCEKGQYIYFEYQPTSSGSYSIESWSNIYDDEVNPIVEIYGGTVGYKFLMETRDTGGASLEGGFTKNFRYELNLEKGSVGACYTFGVSAVSKTGEYPVTIDFAITYEGPYDAGRDVVKVIDAEEARGLNKASESTQKFNYADLGTKLFDGRKYAYDGDSGVYRVYDTVKYASTGGWGPYLCCMIKKSIPCYTTTTIYGANHVGLGQNFLTLRVWDDDYGGYITHDYEDFIRVSYAEKCNSDGVCYVTEELKDFLQLYAKNYTLWTDGVCPTEGSPEYNEYSANQDDLWLFACGFYENGR